MVRFQPSVAPLPPSLPQTPFNAKIEPSTHFAPTPGHSRQGLVVTGEVWFTAADVHRLIGLFQIDHAQPSWPVNLWITSMVQLFDPQIRTLVTERDRVIADWAEQHPGASVFEDRDLEVASEMEIDIDAQRVAIEAALKQAKD